MISFLNSLKSPLGGTPILPGGRFVHLKIALISDEFTRVCISQNARVKNLSPLNYKHLLKFWKPDLVFVESAWKGIDESWKFQVAAYPDHPDRNNKSLKKLVKYARKLGIPTVFWNKEDGVHFERFIDSARLFDYIFTVDETCIPRYRQHVAENVHVGTLPFPVQPLFHRFTGFDFKYHTANFVGSYSRHMHDVRRYWQDAAFKACSDSGLGLIVYDRNSDRKAAHYRYPALPSVQVRHVIKHEATALVYKDNLVTLNVNTIVDSPSMYSRRLIEALACGAVIVSNPSLSMERMFSDFCHVVSTREEMMATFERLKHGPSDDDLARARAGAEFVLANHTWEDRLQQLVQTLGLNA